MAMQAEKRKPPFFSVIVPTYNRAHLLPKAIDSVLKQTCGDFELIVVDDGSEDETKELLKEYTDKRILYEYQQNKGRSAARNLGARLSIGDYICFLDDDDYMVHNTLEIFQKAMRKMENDKILIGQYRIVQGGNVIRESMIRNNSDNKIRFVWNNLLFLQSMCFPKSILKKVKFPVGFEVWEDKHFLLRSILYLDIQIIDDVVCVISEHPDRTVNRVDRVSFREQGVQMIKTIDHLFNNYGEWFGKEIKKNEIKKLKAESLVGKAIDANNLGLKDASYWALREAVTKYFHPKLIFTYINTLRKIISS